MSSNSETTSIPTNPRTTRPVGYAFVDVSTPTEAERAIENLNGKTILDRKVSVQLARKPEPAAAPNTEGGENADGTRRRNSTRGRGRGRGRAGRSTRGGRKSGEEGEAAATNGTAAAAAPLTTSTNEAAATGEAGDATDKTRAPRKQRGPPEDGVPSKTKIMVANLPYDLREERVSGLCMTYRNDHQLTLPI
jgi:RNA recognition motif-containing protein